ncbi:hypothetical protein PR048_001449 [Dryococelus australis]|uniref:Uncharacterized protein n=1 Tax=Dryococelus australis TaxID=614101 RepID=A0ABQ9II38_9NEOP|nr:hypothetical protein PR048_001449 [Dryococelus australis]
MKGWGKRETTEKTRRPDSDTIPTYKNLGVTPLRLELSSPRLLASHQGELSSIPGRVAPDFSQVGIIPRTMPLLGGFSQGSPVSPALVFRRCSIFFSFHPYWLSKPRSCTSVQCFARRGDERVDAYVSVAPTAPTLLCLRRAKFLQPGGHLKVKGFMLGGLNFTKATTRYWKRTEAVPQYAGPCMYSPRISSLALHDMLSYGDQGQRNGARIVSGWGSKRETEAEVSDGLWCLTAVPRPRRHGWSSQLQCTEVFVGAQLGECIPDEGVEQLEAIDAGVRKGCTRVNPFSHSVLYLDRCI